MLLERFIKENLVCRVYNKKEYDKMVKLLEDMSINTCQSYYKDDVVNIYFIYRDKLYRIFVYTYTSSDDHVDFSEIFKEEY